MGLSLLSFYANRERGIHHALLHVGYAVCLRTLGNEPSQRAGLGCIPRAGWAGLILGKQDIICRCNSCLA